MERGRRARGAFIVLEGPDKSGKSTQAALLVRRLRREGLKVLHTREPGGTSFAEAIRRVLLRPRHLVHPLAELFLYEAARAQHTQERLLPALRAGIHVVCERYTLATEVYQGFARGLPLPLVRSLNRIASAGLKPDLTLVLDLPEREFGRRPRRRPHDRLEGEPSSFRSRVRSAYLRLAQGRPGVRVLDSSRDPDKVQDEILRLARGVLG